MLRGNAFLTLRTLVFVLNSTIALQFSDDDKNEVEDAIQKYFPQENNLCVVLMEPEKEVLLPQFHVPVVVFTQDQVLRDCGRILTDLNGYVFITSHTASLEKQIVPLLNCFNRTTLKLKTKYILILDFSKNNHSSSNEKYSNFFYNLWNSFGLINIAIFPLEVQSSDPSLTFSYNPFFTTNSGTSCGLKTNPRTQDIRDVMQERFRNMHGHSLRTVFYKLRNVLVTLDNFYERQTLGVNPAVLLKQVLEESLHASFDVYESSNDLFGLENDTEVGVVGEISSGKAEFCINLAVLPPGILWLGHVQVIPTAYTVDVVFVVPMPRQVESWRLFEYIFQWKVCVGLGIVMFLLSGAALMFVHVKSNSDTLIQISNRTSEVVSVWKAALSVPTNRLPTTHSQRLLIALSLLFGLIFLALFSTQLFSLVKSKPRIASMKTLQDVHDSNLPIYAIYERLASYLHSFENTSLHRLKDNLKTDTFYKGVNYLDPRYLNISDRALVYTNLLTKLAVSLLKGKAYLPYFEVVKEPIFQTSLVIYLPIGRVYYDHFNYVNLRLISGGFYTKWYDSYLYRLMKRYAVSSTPNAPVEAGSQQSDDDRVPLTYNDLRMAFYILYTGLAISSVCFIIELCRPNYKP